MEEVNRGRIDAESESSGGLDRRLGIDLDQQALAGDLAAQHRQRADILAVENRDIEVAVAAPVPARRAGGLMPTSTLRSASAPRAARLVSGTAKEKPGPSARIEPADSVSSALRKFMGGEPMKPATNLLAGVL